MEVSFKALSGRALGRLTVSSAATLEDVTPWLRIASAASARASLSLVRGEARYSEVRISEISLFPLFLLKRICKLGWESAIHGGL